MSKICPKCGASIPENSKYCPVCYERFTNPVDDAKTRESKGLVCPHCGREIKYLDSTHCPHCDYKIVIERPRGLLEKYTEYEKAKASINAIILPILATVMLLVSIVGMFFNLEFLAGVLVAIFMYLVGLICYLYSRY